MIKFVYTFEYVLQAFIGLGALICGFLMVIRPDGSLLGFPLSMLKGAPFKDFMIPGIILFLVNGLGSAYAGFLCLKKDKLAGFAGMFFGFGLMIWIFVQVSMIGGGNWLQNLYFGLGLLEVLFGLAIREVERVK